MVETKIIELMHRELDGLNSTKQSARLEAYLADNREARQFFDDLKGMSHALQEIEPIEPPAHLKHAIANALPRNRYPLRQAGVWATMTGSLAKIFEHRPALAFSSGLALGMAAVLLFIIAKWEAAPLNPASVTGTIVSQNHAQNPRTLATSIIDHGDLKGTLALRSAEHDLWLELELQAGQPVEINVVLENPAGFFNSVSSLAAPFAGKFDNNGASLRFEHQGANRYRIGINDPAPEPAVLHLQILRAGQEIHAQSISAKEF